LLGRTTLKRAAWDDDLGGGGGGGGVAGVLSVMWSLHNSNAASSFYIFKHLPWRPSLWAAAAAMMHNFLLWISHHGPEASLQQRERENVIEKKKKWGEDWYVNGNRGHRSDAAHMLVQLVKTTYRRWQPPNLRQEKLSSVQGHIYCSILLLLGEILK
jgi:cation diffusion facilitator CzcD-associated flavoprotein CzcO